jgi:hypothetical protein
MFFIHRILKTYMTMGQGIELEGSDRRSLYVSSLVTVCRQLVILAVTSFFLSQVMETRQERCVVGKKKFVELLKLTKKV